MKTNGSFSLHNPRGPVRSFSIRQKTQLFCPGHTKHTEEKEQDNTTHHNTTQAQQRREFISAQVGTFCLHNQGRGRLCFHGVYSIGPQISGRTGP